MLPPTQIAINTGGGSGGTPTYTATVIATGTNSSTILVPQGYVAWTLQPTVGDPTGGSYTIMDATNPSIISPGGTYAGTVEDVASTEGFSEPTFAWRGSLAVALADDSYLDCFVTPQGIAFYFDGSPVTNKLQSDGKTPLYPGVPIGAWCVPAGILGIVPPTSATPTPQVVPDVSLPDEDDVSPDSATVATISPAPVLAPVQPAAVQPAAVQPAAAPTIQPVAIKVSPPAATATKAKNYLWLWLVLAVLAVVLYERGN